MTQQTPQKPAPRAALGKGLASLLPGAPQSSANIARQLMGDLPSAAALKPPAPPAAAAPDSASGRIHGITMADVEQIVPNQYQPRRDFSEEGLQEMAESIRVHGVIQPLVVSKSDDGKLHLIAGERRLRASKLAGLKQVPIVIRRSSDKEKLELALIENVQREDLNCVEIALSYFQLSEDFHLTQEEIAKRVGKDRVSVSNHLRILKLPESLLDDLRKGVLSFGHGRALLALADPVARMEVRNRIVERQLSVRETERLIAETLAGSSPKSDTPQNPAAEDVSFAELRDFAERLGRALGTRVKTKGDKYRGSIVIDYFSKEDLERISTQLMR